jgi:putative peptide zinc metalloprotease protein
VVVSRPGLPPAALERLAQTRVGLRADLQVVRQVGAGRRIQYVVHDPVRFDNCLFDDHEYRVLSAIDARRSLGACFDRLVAAGVLEADDRAEFLEFVLLQHQRGLLRLPLADGERTWQRAKRARARRRAVSPIQRLLYWRIPLWNPDPFLRRTLPYVGWFFSPIGVALWCAVVVFSLWSAGGHFWPMLGGAADLLALNNLPALWATLVGLKTVHEFGHAYACRRFGGPVPEMGVALVLTTPCAYVDASSAWAFDSRFRRLAVSFAGMYVEAFVAALALVAYATSGDALVRSIAHNVVVLATVATVLFNVNPLMRFDGYYILSDLTREPNLRSRATEALMYLGRRALGVRTAPPASPRWRLHVGYGLASFWYKVGLAIGIVQLVLLGWPLVGAVLGFVFAWMMLAQPVVRLVRWLWFSDDTRPIRMRARAFAIVLVAVLPAVASVGVPIGLEVDVPGTVVARDGAFVVRAPYAGFVRAVSVRDGHPVEAGQVLVEIEKPALDLEIVRARGELDVAAMRSRALEGVDPGAAEAADATLRGAAARLATLERLEARGVIRAPFAGTVCAQGAAELCGRFVEEGEPLVRIESEGRVIEAWVDAEQLARAGIARADLAEVRTQRDPRHRQEVTLVDIDPVADRASVPEVLTELAGGAVRLDPASRPEDGIRADRAYVRLRFDGALDLPEPSLGTAVRVKFRGRLESLGSWLQRQVLSTWHRWFLR